jgi:hypothetical protein
MLLPLLLLKAMQRLTLNISSAESKTISRTENFSQQAQQAWKGYTVTPNGFSKIQISFSIQSSRNMKL